MEFHNDEVLTIKSEDKIANLYSSLQAVIDTKSNGSNNIDNITIVNPEAKLIPLPPSMPMSPSTSSPVMSKDTINKPSSLYSSQEEEHLEEEKKECPCHSIINQDNLAVCSLCHSPISILEELLVEKAGYEKEIEELKVQLSTEQVKIEEQIRLIGQLNIRIEQTMSELNDKTTNLRGLQNDMEILNDKYVDEIERVAEIQHSKDMVESELEDLSRRLFEEANGMVANEKREKHNLELAQRHLENQLQETRDRLGAEQMQLKELRKRMEDMMELEKQQTDNDNNDNSNNNSSSNSSSSSSSSVTDSTTAVPNTPDHIKDITNLLSERMTLLSIEGKHVEIDNLMLDEFQDFVKAGTSVPLKKIHTIPFMRNCQDEDIEACLRFGPNSRLSARKINEAIVLNTCFIEEAPQGFPEEQAKRAMYDTPLKISAAKSMMWERFSGNNQSTVFSGCQACGRNDGTSLPYRFRVSYFDDWACIDRFCRDRLVAVCEFYVLIRNIRQGLYSSRSIPDLYHEAMRLRLQMFYARMGALPWTLRSSGVKPSTNSSLSTDGLKTNKPQVSTSESSPLPKSVKALHGTTEVPRRGSLNDILNNKAAHHPAVDPLDTKVITEEDPTTLMNNDIQ